MKEDDKKIMNVLKAYLQQKGFQVNNAINGLVALTMFKEKIETTPSDPQLILTVYGIGYKFNPNAGG